MTYQAALQKIEQMIAEQEEELDRIGGIGKTMTEKFYLSAQFSIIKPAIWPKSL